MARFPKVFDPQTFPSMLWIRKHSRELVAAFLIVTISLAWRAATDTPHADAQQPAKRGTSQKVPSSNAAARPVVVAMVNGRDIPRERLLAECLDRHGEAILETILNKRIIEQACAREGILVSAKDVDDDIDTMSKRFNVPRDRWIELIQAERGVNAKQYAEEIVWPMIALRRLARGHIDPSREELTLAFETQFGPAVKSRIIVSGTRDQAEQLHKQALDKSADFGGLARQHSIDVGSASANGWIQPIRKHSGDPLLENTAFALEEGSISQVLQVANQFVFLKCEGRLPAADVKLESVREKLSEEIRERKSRAASTELFRSLQNESKIENIYNDPAAHAAFPELAARVNGQPTTLQELSEACLERHGNDVLEILISRVLIEQALAQKRIVISQKQIDIEIEKAAIRLGFVKADASADIDAWLIHVTKETKIPLRHYVDDMVWPTVALKLLAGDVKVTKEDLDRAFDATFGRRAKCRVIVCDTQRRAQEAWQLARQNPTPDFFGDLAEKYSVDATSKSLRGEIPPIPRYSGQPVIEREAFSLAAGELSGVVQMSDRFMIFLSEGYTEEVKVDFTEVRDELYADIHEKKLRIELGRCFNHLREGASIDNFLAGTSQSSTEDAFSAQRSEPSGITQQQAADLAKPRAGSRQADFQSSPSAGSNGAVPASFQEQSKR